MDPLDIGIVSGVIFAAVVGAGKWLWAFPPRSRLESFNPDAPPRRRRVTIYWLLDLSGVRGVNAGNAPNKGGHWPGGQERGRPIEPESSACEPQSTAQPG